jgi:hypothetical protein
MNKFAFASFAAAAALGMAAANAASTTSAHSEVVSGAFNKNASKLTVKGTNADVAFAVTDNKKASQFLVEVDAGGSAAFGTAVNAGTLIGAVLPMTLDSDVLDSTLKNASGSLTTSNTALGDVYIPFSFREKNVTDYGWIEAAITQDSKTHFYTVVLENYAYTTNGYGIRAGSSTAEPAAIAVPEPASAALLAAGVLSLLAVRRRQRREA